MTEQELGEAEHVLAGLAPGEHHPDAVPGEEDGRERQEQPIPDADELRFLRVQQVVMACWTVRSGRSPGIRGGLTARTSSVRAPAVEVGGGVAEQVLAVGQSVAPLIDRGVHQQRLRVRVGGVFATISCSR